MDYIRIRKALISVSDKTGICEIAAFLHENGCEIISTGGTGQALQSAGIPYTEISRITGNPEAFGGRMKTISYQIESALLFDREKDANEAARLGIEPIDIVICNLYPFAKVKEAGANLETLIENIDIGGPTMLRAAAKNYQSVAAVTDLTDYPDLMAEMKANNLSLSLATRHRLMLKTFNYTADYDSLIATTLDQQAGQRTLRLAFKDGLPLRYGENSHQQGWFYRGRNDSPSLSDLRILHGKELSFNNIADIQSAVESVRGLLNYGCAIIKHKNPCGLAQAADQLRAFQLAWEGDPVSAFGSIIAFNKTLDLAAAEFLRLNDPDKSCRKFIEVIIAPAFSEAALNYLKFHKNLRIVAINPAALTGTFDYKFMNNSLLMQDTDSTLYSQLENVTENHYDTSANLDLIEFGLQAVRQLKSNAIVIVRKKPDDSCQLLGMGAGQPNRLVSTRLALDKSRENLEREFSQKKSDLDLPAYVRQVLTDSLLISDAFFPFPDNVELAAAAGIKNILQPGGSLRDKAVIQTCNNLSVAMVFTGTRHFKH